MVVSKILKYLKDYHIPKLDSFIPQRIYSPNKMDYISLIHDG
tara:strand:- start:135 stop:260 length:126 start_codon:yes stop_codon:yes gene_type:complete